MGVPFSGPMYLRNDQDSRKTKKGQLRPIHIVTFPVMPNVNSMSAEKSPPLQIECFFNTDDLFLPNSASHTYV